MSGSESLKGFQFQIYIMLLSFLEHCINGDKFNIVGEPPKNISTGDIVDISIQFNNNGGTTRKLIQVKKTINTTITKKILKDFIMLILDSGESAEIWFAEYVLENKMKLIDNLHNLKQAIAIPDFAENEISGKFGSGDMIISIDNTVEGFDFNGKTLKISTIDTLEGDQKEQIVNEINRKFGIKKEFVISNIKICLNSTLEYRRHLFVEDLGLDPEIKKRILGKEYNFFNNVVIRQISERELHSEISELLPDRLNRNQKAILKDVLYSLFSLSSSESRPINKSKAEQIMKETMKEFGYEVDYIDWNKKDMHDSPYTDIARGDYSYGGSQL